jgi:flagellar hook-basal body complex protein FliE
MAIDFSTAVNAYKKAAGSALAGTAAAPTPSAVPGGQDSFAAMVGDSLKQAAQTGYEAEALSIKQIAGEADLKDVITAVANAEQTLETVVAVRDKVLNAYNEILKMPI